MFQTTRLKTYGFNKENLVSRMEKSDLDGVLLTSPENIFYTTGYTMLPSSGNPILFTLRNRLPPFFYIDSKGRTTLLCWNFSTLGMEFDVDQFIEFRHFRDALYQLKSQIIKNLVSTAKLGVESTCPFYVLRVIEEFVNPTDLFLVDDIMADLRLIKSEEEIDLIKKSTEIIETTLAELYDVIHIGMSRLDLMQETKSRLFKNGITGISHLTYSFGKTNPEFAIDEKIEEGDLITLDLGGIYMGYASDNRRYMFAGSVPDFILDHYQRMVEIIDTIGEAMVPGVRYSDLYKIAEDLYTKYELGPDIGRIGHNMGLETEEEWIVNDPTRTIKENMVINLELYSFTKSGQLIGNEETYIINEAGSTRITLLPREIRIVN